MQNPLLHLFNAILAVACYRELGSLEPNVSLSQEVAEWFFTPNDNAPLAVVAMSLWLLYRRRERLRALATVPGPPALTAALFLAGLGLLVWSTLTQAPALLVPSLMLSVFGVACLYAGVPALRVLVLPTSFLLFAIPVPPPLLNAIVFELQMQAASYAGWLLFLLGVPALVVGDLISQTQESFRVIETCSGFRSTVTLLMFSILLADLHGRRGLRALMLVVSAPLIAFFLNGLRILGLILNPYSEIATVHEVQGVLILLSGIGLLYAADGLLGRLSRLAFWGGAPETGETPAPAPASASLRLGSRPAVVTGLLLVSTVTSLWLPPWSAPVDPSPYGLLDPLMGELEGWSSSARELDRIFLGSVGFVRYANRRFELGSESVDLMLALDDHPDSQFRSVISPKLGLPGTGWTILESRIIRLEGNGPAVRARLLRSGKSLRLSYQWYQGSMGIWAESLRSLLALETSPFPRGTEILAIRMSTRVDSNEPEALRAAEARLGRFFAVVRPELDFIEEALTRKDASQISQNGKSVSLQHMGRLRENFFEFRHLSHPRDVAYALQSYAPSGNQ